MLGLRRALPLLVLLIVPAALAQVQDDFADGDFTANPPWQGDTDRFTVVPFGDDFALRSDGLAESDTISLATASDVTAGRWTFTFRWEANLTNANGTRVYLVADTPDLTGDVQGYYVQIGTNNSDEIRLYRQDGPPTDRSEIGASDGPVAEGDAGTIFVEVLRDDAGGWRVSVDGTPVIEGVQDDTYTASAALGVWLKHSSANGAAFFWDDFLADPDFDADLSPPTPLSVLVSTNGEALTVFFDEPLAPATVTPGAFFVSGGVGSPVAVIAAAESAELSFDPPIPTGDYTLTITGVEDTSGNATDGAAIDFSFTADTTPPVLVSAEAEDATTVAIAFSEPVLGCDTSHYFIEPDVGSPIGIECPGNGTAYRLQLVAPLPGTGTYTVTATDIEDLNGNSTLKTSASFFFGGLDTPDPRDLVINEVMYDPVLVSANEYVELFNRTDDQTFDLSQLTFSDDASNPVPITDQATILGPGEYAVLVRDAQNFALQFPGVDFIEVDGFPALNNSGDTPTIRFEDTVIDAVPYEPSWGGTDAALERRDPDGPSTSASNFATSTDPRGGTPGEINSVFEVDTTPPAPLDADVSGDGQTITVFFDEPLDPATVVPGNFSVDGGAPAVADAAYDDADFAVALTLAAPLDPGDYTVTITDVEDLSGNATDGATISVSYDPDLTPPALASVSALGADSVAVVFTEPVDEASAGNPANYSINNGIGQPASVTVAPNGDPARVVLMLSTPLSGPQTYTLTVTNVADLNGNVLGSDSATFFFGEGDTPEVRDIVVNEIMYDPPDAASDEYVELFNRSDKTFDLSTFTLADLSSTVSITDDPVFLQPGAYAALVRSPELFQQQFPDVPFIAVDGFPGLNNSGGDAVVIRHAPSGTRVDSVRYQQDWGGTDASLERRSPDGPSNSASNFATSTDPRGGTPAAPNSVPPDTDPPVLTDVDVAADGRSLTTFFDEPLDPATVVPSNFSIDNGAPAVVDAELVGEDAQAVLLTLAAPLASGDYTLTATGVADPLGNVSPGTSFPFTFAPDETPPALLRVSALGPTTLDVLFSEPVTDASAGDPANYAIDNGIGQPVAADYAPDGNLARVTLTLAVPLVEGTSYTLTASNIADLAGNVRDTDSAPFFFGEGDVPAARDVVVNEIQFQSPDGNDGEYVELFNRSEKTFDLAAFTLADAGSSPAPLADAPLFLLPGQYAVLVADAGVFATAFPDAGPVLDVDGFPNLNSTGDAVVIRYPDAAVTVDSVQYDDDWGMSDTTALERIDPAGPSNSAFNWASSVDPRGGTPGAENSVFAPDTGGPTVVFAEQLDATTVRVYFTEPLDPATVEPADFALAGGATPDSVAVSASEPTVDLTFGAVDSGTITVGSVADFVGNVLDGAEVTLARLAPVGGLVVNEILFDPLRDANDGRLDGTEYLEVYNASNFTLTLTHIQITDAPDENGAVRDIDIGGRLTGAVPFAALAPGGYAVAYADTSVFGDRFESPPTQSALADSSLLARFYSGADFSGTLLLPVDRTTLSLTNTEDTIRLLRGDTVLVDSVSYSDDWHRPELDDATGIALERISPTGPSSEAGNWTSSLDPSGGTPGRRNSVFLQPGEAPPAPGLTISPSPFNADVGTQISYTLEADAALVRVRIFDGAGRLVRTLEDAALGGNTQTGTLTWQGRSDDGQPLRIGIYIVFLEALDLNGGRTEAYKEVVVLARNL